jgi:hypothetical protein
MASSSVTLVFAGSRQMLTFQLTMESKLFSLRSVTNYSTRKVFAEESRQGRGSGANVEDLGVVNVWDRPYSRDHYFVNPWQEP